MGVLAALAVVCVVILVDRRGWEDVVSRLREGASALRRALDDPLCAVLAVAVLLAFGYAVALGLATPQNDFDTVFDHLWRAALWRENQAVGYPDYDRAPYINAYPPHGEMGVLATMVLGGSDRYAALVQAAAFVALRGRRRRRGARAGTLAPGGAPRRTAGRDAARDRAAGVDGAERPRRRVFPRRRSGLPAGQGPGAPWLAGGATALAIGTKVSAVFGLPVLVVVALLAASDPSRTAADRRPRRWRRGRVLVRGELGRGRELGRGIPVRARRPWYRRHGRASTWLGDPADRAPRGRRPRPVALPRGRGDPLRGPRGRLPTAQPLAAVGSAAAAALVAVLPVLTPDVRRYADQAYVELWRAVGRDDLAVDVGRDITRSASNVTWYGPLGALLIVAGIVLAVVAARRGIVPWLGALLALAPVYWLVAMSAALFYQDAAGRFLMAPVALAGSMWGLVGSSAGIAWGLTGIAVTALALAALNDTKRPSGLALLERPAPPSYWTSPRWQAVGSEVHVPDLIRFVDERVPDEARVALAITASDPGYVLLGRDLRPFTLLRAGARTPRGASWAFVSPGARGDAAPRLCAAWERQRSPGGWDAYRRVRPRC